MPIITLLTDFGLQEEYVGVMKGVILSINPSVSIIDITHHISPQDVEQAAYTIKSAYRYFPEGTVHVVVVDPGVGSERSIIALIKNGHVFLAPDNGVLTLVMEEGNIDSVVCVNNTGYFLKSLSRTFHGRDLFAPVAAHISKGVEIVKTGTRVNEKNLVYLNIPKPFVSDKGELVGEIVRIDRFGNLITNIDFKRLEKFCGSGKVSKLEIRIGDRKIIGISKSYEAVALQNPLAIIGSSEFLEIAVNSGSAKLYFMSKKKDAVKIFLPG